MSPRRPLLAAVLAGAALVAGGCGAEAGSDVSSADFKDPTQQAVEATVTDFSDAVGKRDYDQICSDLLAAPLVKAFDDAKGTGDCADQIELSFRDVDKAELAVRTITVQGTNAVALVRPTGTGDVEKDARIALVKEGSRWKLSGLG